MLVQILNPPLLHLHLPFTITGCKLSWSLQKPIWHWCIHVNIALPWEYHSKQETGWSGDVWGWDNRGGNSEQTTNNRRIEIFNQAMWDMLQGADVRGCNFNLNHYCSEQGDCPSNISMFCILLISNIKMVLYRAQFIFESKCCSGKYRKTAVSWLSG